MSSPEILTKEEIAEILKESENEKYSDPKVMMHGTKKNSIFLLSRKSSLILVYGNSVTGYNHIYDRHSQMSRMPFWEGGKIGLPSKFPIEVAPIQYLEIAAKIYSPGKRKERKPNDMAAFDVYEGTIEHKNSRFGLRLVTYGGTGIIHTLYPTFRQPKLHIRSLRRGFVSDATYYPNKGLQTFAFSYFDNRNVEIFKVIIRTSEFSFNEKWYVQVNDENGVGILTTLLKQEELSQIIQFQFRLANLDFTDNRWIERALKQMILNKYKF